MNPGMAAVVKPISSPPRPEVRNAHRAECSKAKNNAATVITTDPRGIMVRGPKRRSWSTKSRLATKLHTDNGTRTSPDTTTEAENPKPARAGSA
jgi:hypothetical protein